MNMHEKAVRQPGIGVQSRDDLVSEWGATWPKS